MPFFHQDDREMEVARIHGAELHGSVTVLVGRDSENREIKVGCDWRMAEPVVGALRRGEKPEIEFAPYQVLWRSK